MRVQGIFRRSRPARAFTLSELMVSVGISSLVMMTIAGLMYMAARHSRDVLGQARMRSARTEAIDEIRYRLCNAKIGSIDITDEGHTISFLNPNLSPTIKSRFSFLGSQKTLYYDELVGAGRDPLPVAKGPIDIKFSVLDLLDDAATTEPTKNAATIRVTVKSESNMQYKELDKQEGEVVVYLRNI